MELSVLIPTYGRPAAVNRCLGHLADQLPDAQCEIIVGLDGEASVTPDPVIPDTISSQTRVCRFGRIGLLRLRQSMLGAARGRVVLWLNDDTYAHPGLLQAHLNAHDRYPDHAVVVGRAEWMPVKQPSLFDSLVQKSDLVFFAQPSEPVETDYRNCYGLNMSFPREIAIDVGGVAGVEEHYGYEDIELAWRLSNAGARCVYEPRASVTHDHRYTPKDVHRREYLLGRAAFAFGHENPDFAFELFGTDIRDACVLASYRDAAELAWRDALRVESSFFELDQRPQNAVHEDMLPLLAEHWVLLKRLLWRWGVLDAARGIQPRWSLLSETSPDQALRQSLIDV
jgi:GT2 family glycosyltransferase